MKAYTEDVLEGGSPCADTKELPGSAITLDINSSASLVDSVPSPLCKDVHAENTNGVALVISNDDCDTQDLPETPLDNSEARALHSRVSQASEQREQGGQSVESDSKDPIVLKESNKESSTSQLHQLHVMPISPLEQTEKVDSDEEGQDDGDSAAIISSSGNNNNTNLPWWYPRCRGRPVFYGSKEALGWACTAVAHAAFLIGTGAFILPALSKLAEEEAGCETEAPSGEDIPECEGTVHGLKPSSLLTVMSTVAGLISVFIIPPMGAVIDYTSHRRGTGRCLSVCYSMLILSLAFLGEDTWFALVFVLLILVSIGWAQAMLFNAYLPELTDDETRLNEFSKTFTVLIFTTMVVYLAGVAGIGIVFGFADDDVALARCAAIVAFVLSSCMFFASWWLLFDEREAFHVLPEGQSLVVAGFRQVYSTSKRIWNDYKALKWFYISICFGDAAIQSLTVISITYVTNQLEFGSQEVGVAALLLLLGSIPGAVVGGFANSKLNPIRGSSLAVFGMSVGTILAALVLQGPGQQAITYVFAFLWGFGTGWKYTGDRVLAAGIIPKGQDAELMGFYMFCGQIFAWAPSLVFTILNEAGVSMRIGFGLLGVIFLGALFSYVMMGDYAEAVAAADRLRVETIPSVKLQQLKDENNLRDGCIPTEISQA